MEKYNYQKDLQESFYLSKRFKKIKQLVINDLSPLSKYQIFKIRLYRSSEYSSTYLVRETPSSL